MATRKYFVVWDKIAKKYSKDKITSKVNLEHKKIFKEVLKKGTLLDVGCAHGKHLVYTAKKGFTVTGLDISREMIRQAKKILNKEGIKANLIVGSATNLPFRNNSFYNVICMGNSIGTIPKHKDRIKAITEIIRVAKKKALLELLKSDTSKGVSAKYWFSGENERYYAKRWNEQEIVKIMSDIRDKLNINYKFKIKKGRKALLGKYIFYLIIKK